jgi:hypothetical protein
MSLTLKDVLCCIVRISWMIFVAITIGHIWLPVESHYRVSNNAIIQCNDWIVTGYRANYYSHLFGSYRFSHYAEHVVALSGRKDVGYTPVNAGEVGSTCINPSGFYPLVFFTFCFLVVSAHVYEFFHLDPSKHNFFMRVFCNKDSQKNDKSNNQSLSNGDNNQVKVDNGVNKINYKLICVFLCSFIIVRLIFIFLR